jgi:ribosomal protein S24E
MELNITDKKEQKLLSRLEVSATISFNGSVTPSNDAVKDAIAKKIGKDIKLVVVKGIYTKYGDSSADVNAYVYDNEKKLDEIEVTHKKVKEEKKEDEETPAAVAPKAEEKKEEAPKEEPKAEEKSE